MNNNEWIVLGVFKALAVVVVAHALLRQKIQETVDNDMARAIVLQELLDLNLCRSDQSVTLRLFQQGSCALASVPCRWEQCLERRQVSVSVLAKLKEDGTLSPTLVAAKARM